MEFVNVAIRIKPISNDSKDKCLDIYEDDTQSLYIPSRQQLYTFDKIFDQDTDQNVVFTSIVEPLIEKVLLGYNCTVLAYGQTGTGKTYTMGSDMKQNGKNIGIINRVFQAIFLKDINIELSVCEIYQEKVYDLLGNNNTALIVKGMNSITLAKAKVCDLNSVQKLLVKSCKRRHTGETKQNAWSSRSHAIFTLHIMVQDEVGTRTAKLNLVDLAGCESVKKTGTQDSQFNEAIKINMGLLSIGLVVNALTCNKTCIPYRESMLTRILYDSLNKESYITLIACVSPNMTDLHETIQTLDFAMRTKKMKTKPKLNSVSIQRNRNAFYDLKTPMKRRNPFVHTSTSVKRPILTPSINVLNSKTFQSNLELCSIVSPIARIVIDKLDNRYKENIKPSSRNTEFYETMHKLIEEEVHLQTNSINNSVTNNLLISSSTPNNADDLNVENVLNEISTVLRMSPNKINLSGIIPNNSTLKDIEMVFVEEGSNKVNANERNTPQFKKPQLPNWHCTTNIINEPNQPRKSLRLSMKVNTTNMVHSCLCNDASGSSNVRNNVRKSIRIAQKRTSKHSLNYSKDLEENMTKVNSCSNLKNIEDAEYIVTAKNISRRKRKDTLKLKKRNTITDANLNDSSIAGIDDIFEISQDVIDISQEATFYEETIKTFPIFAQRRSIRLSTKRGLTSTLSGYNESIKTSSNSIRSVVTDVAKTKRIKMHKDEVLKKLNKGSEKEIQKLHTIGVKTATQICLFRKLNGPFKAIDDLRQVLYQGKLYERFLTANCLTHEVSPNDSVN